MGTIPLNILEISGISSGGKSKQRLIIDFQRVLPIRLISMFLMIGLSRGRDLAVDPRPLFFYREVKG